MNKQELIDGVAKRLGVTKSRAAEIAEVLFAPDGIIVGGVNMPETMIYENERQTPMDNRWFMAWSGMVGRAVPEVQ